jgi:ribosome-associated translation inhibitor RaiA
VEPKRANAVDVLASGLVVQFKHPTGLGVVCVEADQCGGSVGGRGLSKLQLEKDKAMQTPVQIDFQGMEAKHEVRGDVAAHIAQLEERYGRVTAGRVVLKAPGGHHRTGGVYEVNIRLSLPEGREVNVARTAHADERHADLSFAINDAFKRARRQLQDHSDRMQGKVKAHGLPPEVPTP